MRRWVDGLPIFLFHGDGGFNFSHGDVKTKSAEQEQQDWVAFHCTVSTADFLSRAFHFSKTCDVELKGAIISKHFSLSWVEFHTIFNCFNYDFILQVKDESYFQNNF